MNALLAWYFVAVWGAGYVATKIGLQYAPPFTFLSLRFGFGLLCLLPVVLMWKPRWQGFSCTQSSSAAATTRNTSACRRASRR